MQMFIVNAPMIFKAMWAVISPWLEQRTQAKIQVISNEKQGQQALLAAIPPENLIARLGGSSQVDPFADHTIGPWADPSVLERSQWKFKDSTLTASSASADTAVDVAAV
jgi:CRAL/TRIO domain